MHLTIIYIIFFLSLFFFVIADNNSTNCAKACPFVFKPICASIENKEKSQLNCTFPNDCYLDIYTCMVGKKELQQNPEVCLEDLPECANIVISTFRFST
ncbi:hypothetical protein FF38_02042 [Lucilia cuprina]|uniref:Kazal-like domain-containing protein n=1 Tax=Lucilia cuprina TaxID=7375 RepID=A0A0L0BW75_LUCCU|nr:hypothetical protein CVS40_9974 [Lucilia cuprina]KNC24278.1 hypothetical protein FF38_02042 [Lucilia cuprina]